ncbi:penicillin-binding protein 2 [Actinomycetaceae bacterium TAE3-ERU4]|nr:penicillin-binding protein 2 [Actinomycetaceae bacterium TAE3-ERU4]
MGDKEQKLGGALSSQGLNKRAKYLRLGLVFFFSLLVLPLVWVQIINGPAYAKRGIEGRSAVVKLEEPRGTIYDREGKVLASSATRYDVVANPVEVANYRNYVEYRDANGKKHYRLSGVGPLEAARELAPILNLPEAEIGGLLTQTPHTQTEGEEDAKLNRKERKYSRRYSVIARNVTPEVMRKIRNLKIRGIDGVYKTERIYPRGETAANVIGFMKVSDKDNTKTFGAAGLEMLKEDTLKSIPGREVVEIGANGVPIPGGYSETTPAKKGTDIHLTLDADLTDYAQKIADETQKNSASEWVLIIVEEVKTGRILALGDSGVVTPAEATKDKPILFGSRAVKDVYEPGSTGKLITVATALEQGKITPITPVMSYGKWTAPNGQTFQDSHEHDPELLTAAGVLAESSNTGTILIGEKVTDKQRYDMMRAFGWGEKSGIDLPSENAGFLKSPEAWDGRQRYTTMFGQGVATTPLQVVDMVATIGNGGVRNKVHLIDGYTRPDGTYKKVELGQPKQVISASTAKNLVRMMEGVVTEGGTAPNAKINGYNVAAKTGTSEILSGKRGYVASFAGLVPAENPAVSILVVAYRPKNNIFGGVVAVPPFKKIATRTMATLGVPPSSQGPNLFPLKAK